MDKKEKIENRLWFTKKSRMNAEKRLLSNYNFLNFSNVYYSIFIAIISIFSLITNKMEYSIASVILSVALIISLSFASSLNYKERADKMRKNYIDINQLETELRYATNETTYKEIETKYNEILYDVENHLPCDWQKVKYDNNDLKIKEKTSYYFYCFKKLLFKTIISIIPIVTLIAIYIIKL